jgi:hypothetical protein
MRAAMASNLAANALVRRKVEPGAVEKIFDRRPSDGDTYNPKNAFNALESARETEDNAE